MWVKPHTLGERKWKKATVVAQRSEPHSYDIKMNTGEVLRRNRVDLRKSSESNDVSREQNSREQNVDEEEHDKEGGKQLQRKNLDKGNEDIDTKQTDSKKANLKNDHYVTLSGRISGPPIRYPY